MDTLRAVKFAQAVQVFGKQDTFIKSDDGYEIKTDRQIIQITQKKTGAVTLTTWANVAWAIPNVPFFELEAAPTPTSKGPGRPKRDPSEALRTL